MSKKRFNAEQTMARFRQITRKMSPAAILSEFPKLARTIFLPRD
jgi:hypothetical protein